MAEDLLIGPSRASVKLRSPWAVALLPFITLGIYHLVWWYRINRELRDVGHGRGVDLGEHPTNSLLALLPGALIIIPPFVTYWRGTKRVMHANELTTTEPLNGWIALILFIVIQPAYWAYMQSSLNHAWRAAAEEPTGTRAAVEAAPTMAAELASTTTADGATPDTQGTPAGAESRAAAPARPVAETPSQAPGAEAPGADDEPDTGPTPQPA
jgi:Domain of unknown function (DUF4234)